MAVGAMVISLPILLNLVEMTDKQSKGTLQRPKHVNFGEKTKGDGQHEEAGNVKLHCVFVSCLFLYS